MIDNEKRLLCLMQVLSHPDIQADAQAFLDSTRGWPVSQRRKICVLQREFAVLDLQREPDSILYSIEATTCLIVAAVQGSQAVLTHIDDYRQLPDLLQSMQQPSIWLLGAFCDPKGQGPLLAGQVLKVMPDSCADWARHSGWLHMTVLYRHAASPPLAACCKSLLLTEAPARITCSRHCKLCPRPRPSASQAVLKLGSLIDTLASKL